MEQGIIENLIEELSKLPSIGRKTAQRHSFFILAMPRGETRGYLQSDNCVKGQGAFLQGVL